MGRVGINWVTDRLPTEADADSNGDVYVADRGHSQWNNVKKHEKWCVTYYWEPRWATTALNVRREQQADAEKPQPQIIWPQDDSVEVLWRCNNKRRIISIFRTVHEYGHTLDVIADDGTAWCLIAGNESWEQLPELPMKEGA